ncbi:MAG: hypothetical protein D6712_03355 [Chloroflexi bacterium]|nr:MAG: hypothetical protein D6712_03355 [Chloroflexota bacterium]
MITELKELIQTTNYNPKHLAVIWCTDDGGKFTYWVGWFVGGKFESYQLRTGAKRIPTFCVLHQDLIQIAEFPHDNPIIKIEGNKLVLSIHKASTWNREFGCFELTEWQKSKIQNAA